MNCEQEDIIEYLEYKANNYSEEKKNELEEHRWICLDVKESTLRELISDIKNGVHLDF